ncbi:MAG TPA: pyridoxamine 5'-phosphate oxidase family protein [Spirochaetia bacterium]|nr:pyridoxamine 5'-phosphate oxidase family protein [Spirochaetia bacterium]
MVESPTVGGAIVDRKLRRIDRAISIEEAEEILRGGEWGLLSTVSASGQPYGVPVNYVLVGKIIYFHCALEGDKLENLRHNNRVSFCVVGETEVLPAQFATRYESVIVFGKAVEVLDEEKQIGLVGLIEKYSAGYMDEGRAEIENSGSRARVYGISIESISGKARR